MKAAQFYLKIRPVLLFPSTANGFLNFHLILQLRLNLQELSSNKVHLLLNVLTINGIWTSLKEHFRVKFTPVVDLYQEGILNSWNYDSSQRQIAHKQLNEHRLVQHT